MRKPQLLLSFRNRSEQQLGDERVAGSIRWWSYVVSALMVAGAVWLRLEFNPILGKHSPLLLFPIVVLIASRFGGWLPGLLATVLSTLGGWFFLTDPPNSFYIADKAEAESLAMYAISATVISLLGAQVHASLLSKTRSEQAARQNESLARALLDSSAQAILAVDSEGKIVMTNAMTEKTFGYKRDELLNQPIDLLIPKDVESIHRDHLKSFFDKPADRRMVAGPDIKARHRNGSAVPVEIGLSHAQTARGMLAIAFVTDNTQKRRTEQERQKFVSLAESSLEFIGMCDLDFKPFYVNPAGLRLVGLDDLEAGCRITVQDYFFPEDRPFITGEFLPGVLRDGHGKVEIRFRHFQTGKPIWMLYNVFSICDASGAVVGWATVSIDVTERKRAERALEESRQELRSLAARLINAQEEAHMLLSRELHDDLSQKLAILAFDASLSVDRPDPSPAEMKQLLANVHSRVVQLSEDVRKIAHRFHPSILDDLGLSAALRELSTEYSAREGTELIFEESNIPKDVPVATATCLYRVAQEALRNISKHAQASQVRIAIGSCPEGICLSISDNGAGFDTKIRRSQHSLGLVSMKERVLLISGKFSIQSEPGRGTVIRAVAPVPKEMS